MAAQLYSNTQLAQALYEVLQELVADERVPESLAVASLDQLDQSVLAALRGEVRARADVRGGLDTYKYYDSVWQFGLSNVAFRINPSGGGSMKRAAESKCERARLVCVDVRLAPGATDEAAGEQQAAK